MFFKSRADHSESDDLRPKKRSKDKASLSPSAPSPARIPEKLSKKHNVANDELMIGEFMYKGGPMYITQCYILYGKKSSVPFNRITGIQQVKAEVTIRAETEGEVKFKKMKDEVVARGCYLVLVALWHLNNPDPKAPLQHMPPIDVPEVEQKEQDTKKKKGIVAALTGDQQEIAFRVIVRKNGAAYTYRMAHFLKQSIRIREPKSDTDLLTVQYADVEAVILSDTPLQVIIRNRSGEEYNFLINKYTEFVTHLKQRCFEADLRFGECASRWCDTNRMMKEVEGATSALRGIRMMGMRQGSLPKKLLSSQGSDSTVSQRSASLDALPVARKASSGGMSLLAGASLQTRKEEKDKAEGLAPSNVIKSETMEAITEDGDLVHLGVTRARGPQRKRRAGQRRGTSGIRTALQELEEEER